MKQNFKGKKILILGGAYQHRKLVSKAKEMGIITYVTDYLKLEDSPAKIMADYKYYYNLTDYDDIEKLCREENIDGIIAPYLDVTQIPYQELCERMGYPCFGDKYQHKILTDKKEFKSFCVENGADIIPSYIKEQIYNNEVDYPVLIKPNDSRGSRGQTICNNKDEALKAIQFAKSESKSGFVIIEKYMGNAADLQLVYLVVDREPILVRVEDRFVGESETGLDKLCIATIDSSRFEDIFRKSADKKIRSMIKKMGLVNSPVFIQAFMDGDIARCYDPGIRLPGDDYDIAYKDATGIDMAELLIYFALTGQFPVGTAEKIENARIQKATAMILPGLKPGRICSIDGLDEIMSHEEFLEMSKAYSVGDVVEESNNVKQRFGEFVISCEDYEKLEESIQFLFRKLSIKDENGCEMLFAKFDTKKLDIYKK